MKTKLFVKRTRPATPKSKAPDAGQQPGLFRALWSELFKPSERRSAKPRASAFFAL